MINHPIIPVLYPNETIHFIDEFKSIDSSIEVLIVDKESCNDECLASLDLSSFSNLRVFDVGDDCFENVNEVKLIGLKELERVLIGKGCFRMKSEKSPNRHFYLKDCERLRELKIGHHSFSDYSVCEIENVPSLEVIEMGELDEGSYNFIYASLELKSDCERMN